MTEQDHELAGVSPEAKASAVEFLASFKSFKDDIAERMAEVSGRVEALDRKAADVRRPVLATQAGVELPHKKAFAAYVRRGEEDGLKALDVEAKGLNTAVQAEGGYLVTPQTAATIDSVLRSAGNLRAIARVVQVEAGAYDVLVDHNEIGAGWNDETTVAETTAPLIDRISIQLNELSANPKASQRLLDDAAFDVESWLAERVADRFLRAESAAFVNGDGVNKPKGFLTKPMVEDASWAWGSIGYVATGTSGGFDPNDPADALIDLVYALDADYRAGASFVMNSRTAGEVRKMKDAQGRFLWVEGLSMDHPARLLGYPVTIVEDMPDIGVDATPIAFGDFGHGYTVAERPDMRVLRDPYSAKPHVMFYATRRVGGDVTDYAAIKVLKFGTS
ncbi:MAG TPA: phage major capsid protein [Thermohalobaculum sp.]|nr:phage major capsid protein [Thermohalobaculum sp.]